MLVFTIIVRYKHMFILCYLLKYVIQYCFELNYRWVMYGLNLIMVNHKAFITFQKLY